MKKKVFIITIVFTMFILVIIGGYTLAKYYNNNSFNASSKIAKWTVSSSLRTKGTESTDIKLVNTYNSETLVENKIAPGTSGQFDIVIDARGTETGLDYFVKFIDAENSIKPTNLKFTALGVTKSNLQDLEDIIKGTIDANETDTILTIPVAWSWQYETVDEDGTSTKGDIQDASDGENLSNYTFTVNVTCTQVVPVNQ